MPQSPLQSIRRYQSISVFGGGVIVTVLILIACVLGMTSIVYGYLEGERRNFLSGMKETLNEIKVSETSFRNGVANAQLIWREDERAADSVVDAFFDGDQRLEITPYPSLVLGAPGQTGNRAEVAHYLALSFLLSRICAASSINRGRLLEGYHYSTRTGVFALVPNRDSHDPALATPEGRARMLDALRIDFGGARPVTSSGRPLVHWLPPFVDPVSGQARIRIAAQASADGTPFAVLVTEYAPEYLLSWLPEHRSDGTFFVTTADNRPVAIDPEVAADRALKERLLRLNVSKDEAASDAPVFQNGFVIFRGTLDSTGWTIAYALSWTDLAAGIALRAGTLTAATLLAIAVMWILLVRFHRRVLVPVYARSQRVFDSEALCRSVIEMAPVGLGLIARPDGHFMLVSPALTEMVSRIGGDYRTLSSEVVARYQVLAASGASPGPLQDDLVLAGTDAHLHLEYMVCGARYQEHDVLIVAIADVTAKRQLVQKLEEAVRAADSANAAKSSFLAAMSHEIRTPLNVILGNLELLDRSALDGSQRSRVHAMRTSSTGLLALVSDILDFSKIEAGAMSVESIEFDVVAMIEHELSAFAPIAKSKGLQLFCEIDAASTQGMRGDPTRLAQVFRNLLNNALKFTSVGRVIARLSVVAAADARPELLIEVEDTGIGIAADHHHKLFKAFSQVDASIARRYGGTGLGLALCDRLVTAMGGSIAVTSAPGVGSRFSVRFPLGTDVVAIGERKPFDACSLTLVAARAEWRNFALPHLRAWGFEVDVYDSPICVPVDRNTCPSVVVVFGDSDDCSDTELDDLLRGAPVILATRDGPLQPYSAGGIFRVSSYSISGLRAALTQAGALFARRTERRRVPTQRSADPPPARSLRVLVADDESVNRLIFRDQLDALGCSVEVVTLGKDALESLEENRWDVLLIGADLPDMGACALAGEVRDRGSPCDVVVVTSYLMPGDKHGYVTAGVHKVLTKPVTLAHLLGAMANASRRSGASIQEREIEV